jgi:hypothetical protein
MAHSYPSALQNWHSHVFDALGGSHERISEMAVSMPADGKAVDALLELSTGLNELGRFRKHERLPFEREGLAMVERRKGYQVRDALEYRQAVFIQAASSARELE